MMKKVLFAVVVMTTIGLTSCTKCYKCSYGNNFATEVCKGENQTNAEYTEAIDDLEDDGYTCK